jgi:hypothetical protein
VIATNDAAGGAGSIKDQLLGIAINGLSTAIDGRLARRYGLGTFNETETDTGAPSGAPQGASGGTQQVVGFLSNPVAIAIAAAVALSVLIFIAIRR